MGNVIDTGLGFRACRGCLSPATENFHSIFDGEIVEKFKIVTGVSIDHDKNINEALICDLCLKQLNEAFEWRQQVNRYEIHYFSKKRDEAASKRLKVKSEPQLESETLFDNNNEVLTSGPISEPIPHVKIGNQSSLNEKSITESPKIFSEFDQDNLGVDSEPIPQTIVENPESLNKAHGNGRKKRVKNTNPYLQRTSTKIKSFSCDLCGFKSFNSDKGKLKSHMESHKYRKFKGNDADSDRPFLCSFKDCGKSYTSIFLVKLHEKIHNKGDNYNSRKNVKKCVQKNNPNRQKIECNICGKQFINFYVLKAHYKNIHDRIRNFSCDLCGSMSYHKANFRKHMEAHIKARSFKQKDADSDRPFLCSFKDCGKSFTSIKLVKLHERIHNKGRQFVCSICSKGFKLNCYLKVHQRRMHGIDNFSKKNTRKIIA